MHTSTVPTARPIAESFLAGVVFAAATVAVAGIGSVATRAGQDWYETLDKPEFTPPDATFSIVWSILYVAIAAAGWLAWRAGPARRPTVAWAVQMALNLAWTSVFFGLRSPIGGVVVIAALIAAVAVNLREASRVSSTAAVLLFPYLIWCCFAAALTAGVAVLN